MIRDFLNVFGMADDVVLIDDEDRPAQDAKFFDQGSIVLTERAAAMIGDHFDVIDAESPAPTLLSEGKIHADGINPHSGKLAGFFIETLGLGIADRRIERWYDAENAYAVAGGFEIDRAQCVVDGLKVGRVVAGLELRANRRKRFSSECSCTLSFHIMSILAAV